MLFVLITYTGVQHDFNITWCLCRLEVARRMPPVEEELEHLRSPSFFLRLLFFLFFGGWSCCSIFTATYYFVLITYSGVRHDFNITWCLCRLELALRVSSVEQELFTGLEHPRSPTYFYFFGEGGRFMLLNLYWSLVFCRSFFVLLFFFFWSLYCLSFFELRLLIIPLVSSNIF